MKHYRQVITITTDEQEQFMNLSYEVEECVRQSGVSEGVCVVLSQHTTSSIFLENDKELLHKDIMKMLKLAINFDSEYQVDYIKKGDQHIKHLLLGSSVSVPISAGKLDLGPRQYIMYGDFDGMREKSVVIKIIGE